MRPPIYQRLHPLTILVEIWRAVGRFVFIIALFIFYAVTGRGGDTTELIFGGIGVLVALGAIVRYYTFEYAIHDGKLMIREGLITRKQRTIPLDRIQNINLRRDIPHRVLGLVDLEIETPGGAKAEATLSALSESQALVVKQRLSGATQVALSPYLERRREEVIYAITPRELFLAGATENRLFAILATLFGVFAVAPQVQEQLIRDTIREAGRVAGRGPADAVLWVGIALVALLVGWIAAIIQSFVAHYGFELTMHEGRLRRHFGLLSQVENVVPIRRIQVFRTTQNFIQAALGMMKVYVETAGSFGADADSSQREQQSASRHGKSLLAPLTRDSAVGPMLRRIFPHGSLEPAEWSSLPSRALTCALLAGWWLLPAVVAGVWWINTQSESGRAVWLWLVPALWIPIKAWSAYVATRRLKFHDDGEFLVVRSGFLFQTRMVIPFEKVQLVQLTQSPLERRFGLADLRVMTGATTHGSVALARLDAKQAAEWAESIHRRSAESAWKNPDGF
ncbi:MAG: PH domain-containing protein [Fimbriimonadaceae bacterium]|nr:PH domain-containing protein [Fimbriimonadaceae bacterium]